MREITLAEREFLIAGEWVGLARLRGDLLRDIHAEMRRWEALAIGAENQRDVAIAERDDAQRLVVSLQNLLENSRREIQAYDVAYYAVVAERDALRKQLDDIRHDYTDKGYWGEK